MVLAGMACIYWSDCNFLADDPATRTLVAKHGSKSGLSLQEPNPVPE